MIACCCYSLTEYTVASLRRFAVCRAHPPKNKVGPSQVVVETDIQGGGETPKSVSCLYRQTKPEPKTTRKNNRL